MSGERSAAEELAEFEPQEAAQEAPVEAPEVEADAEVEAPSEAPPETPDEEPVETRARRLGWKPEAEWKGPKPDSFMSAEEYVERFAHVPQTVSRLERQLREREAEQARSLKAMEAALKRQHQREIEELKAAKEKAKADYDFDAYERAAQREAELRAPPEQSQGPDPTVKEWLDGNPHIRDNPVLIGALRTLGDEAVQAGHRDAAAQIAYAERRLGEMYPGLMTKPEQERPKPPASAVDGGGVVQPRGRRTKGWDDMPEAERSFAADAILGPNAGKKEKEAFAAQYWKDNADG